MKRIAAFVHTFLAIVVLGLWSCSRTPVGVVLTVPSEERAKYKENFQEVCKWAELNGDYSTYTLADPQRSIALESTSLDVIVKIETAATPSDWTDTEFRTHYKKVTEDFANKVRTDLIDALKPKCAVADNAGQRLFIAIYIDGYDFGSGKARAAFRPAIFLFDTRAKTILWFLNSPASSKRIVSDELMAAVETSIRQSMGLDTQAHNVEPSH
jgi:hypothetical protein